MIRDLETLRAGYSGVMAGFCVVARHLLIRDREGALPAALAGARGWPCASLDVDDLAALARVGFCDGKSAVSHAALWSAPDARFAALLVRRGGVVHGVVVVTPHGFRRPRATVAAILREGHRPVLPVPVPPPESFADVKAYRVDGRLAVQRAGVETADDLERLMMCACAILDA